MIPPNFYVYVLTKIKITTSIFKKSFKFKAFVGAHLKVCEEIIPLKKEIFHINNIRCDKKVRILTDFEITM